MKEIKPFVRTECAGEIIRALKHSGFSRISVNDVAVLGELLDPNDKRISFEYEGEYTKDSKIEVLCRDADTKAVTELITKIGCTHQEADGLIYVIPVDEVIHIGSGKKLGNTPSPLNTSDAGHVDGKRAGT